MIPPLVKSIFSFLTFYSLGVVLVVFIYSVASVAFAFAGWLDALADEVRVRTRLLKLPKP